MTDARVRLTITGGNLNMLQSEGKPAVDPTIAIVAQPPTRYPDHFFERGVIATIADTRLSPLDPMAGHKTLNYWPRISALQAAAAKRAGLVACDDFAAAIWMVARLSGELLASHDDTVALGAVLGGSDLVRFYLSDGYQQIRDLLVLPG